MSVTKRVTTTGSKQIVSYPAGAYIPFGAAVVPTTATEDGEIIKGAQAETSILGLAGVREFLPLGGYDGFWKQYEPVDIIDEYGYALVVPNGSDTNINAGDFLEVAVLGDGTPGYHGLLEEAGSSAGGTFTTSTVAKALEGVTMGSKSYKIPASDVSIGDETITMTAGEIATMGISIGDYICLEDLNGNCQVNKVAALTSTVISLVMPSTVALANADSDLVTRVYHCLVKLVK